ncbi:MAG: SGNH/GDSL hydrolase family protein [Gemmatimonadaceae bacterium]|nr:SGNH/GDSL hydrolase family protein [Gemmatimonadaceae bacterium]
MNLLRGAAVAGLLGTLVSCQAEHTVGPLYSAGPLFQSYVSLGNSLTAGYQSGGIDDSTQQRGYAVLLARQFGTRFAYPSLLNPGCPPPISVFQTGARVTPTGYPPSTEASCYLRNPTSVTDILNNVAVPGAFVADLTSPNGAAGANALTTFILGGLTQAQRALLAKPTFATIWIGNNDILGFALSGQPAGATPLTTFTANYDAMISQLLAGAPKLKGVLLGVIQVAAAPQLFPAAALANPLFVGGLSQAVGTPVTIHPDCLTPPGNQSLINIQIITLLQGMAAQHQTPIIVCAKGDVPGLGDFLVLDAAEQATVFNLINSYNAYISQKAASIGFAYWDPNALLAQLATVPGAINYPPNLASLTAPFGTAISLDGIHPSSSTHIAIANALIGVINAKYGTNVQTIQ